MSDSYRERARDGDEPFGLPRQTAEAVVEIVPLVMRSLAAELRRSGHLLMPAQFGVLFHLAEHKTCNLSELAEALAVSLPTVSNIVSRMVERGWVARERSATDRRVVLVTLTPAGLAMMGTLYRHAVDSVVHRLAPLETVDQRKLRDALVVLRQAFAPG